MQDQQSTAAYRGRFAPSPTGDLHFGSLVAAVGSFLQARSRAGKWLIRMEDLDPPREVAGSAERIIADLAAFGMVSDEPVIYQSNRLPVYERLLRNLLESKLAFQCGCSRRDLPDSGIYPGTCRQGIPKGRIARSVRLISDSAHIEIHDAIQGIYSQDLEHEVGDFIIRRGDGLIAYQLATPVDDAWQRITEVVRGADLLASTPRQIHVQRMLGLPTPAYAHLPVVMNKDGNKLSKRTMADPVAGTDRVTSLRACLDFLGHAPPPDVTDLDQMWRWAIDNWRLSRVPAQSHVLPRAPDG
jgi:glutamyl-Q tRNA(Asp) synthetase